MINKIENIITSTRIQSIYNYDEYTLQELLCKFFEKINQCIDSSNQALEFMDWVRNEGLPNEVIKELEKMYNDGRISALIDKVSGDLKKLVNDTKLELQGKITEVDTRLDTKIDTNKSELTQIITSKETDLKTNYLTNLTIDGGTWNE